MGSNSQGSTRAFSALLPLLSKLLSWEILHTSVLPHLSTQAANSQTVFQGEPSHLESEVSGVLHGCGPVSSPEQSGLGPGTGSPGEVVRTWGSGRISVANKMTPGQGSGWLLASMLGETCGEGKPEVARITTVNNVSLPALAANHILDLPNCKDILGLLEGPLNAQICRQVGLHFNPVSNLSQREGLAEKAAGSGSVVQAGPCGLWA